MCDFGDRLTDACFADVSHARDEIADLTGAELVDCHRRRGSDANLFDVVGGADCGKRSLAPSASCRPRPLPRSTTPRYWS